MTRETERPKKKLKSRKWSIRLHLTNMQNDMAERQVMLRDQDTIDQDQIEPQEVEYLYMLPEDDAEVLVSGASMAIIDIAKKPPMPDARAIQERALWHCDMTNQHIRRGELTNDYEGFKYLFITSYTNIYERDPQELTETAHGIMNRHDLQTVLIEIRTIIKGLYFPDRADLEMLAMEYKGILMTPHRSFDGYYTTFLWRQVVTRTPNLPSPTLALVHAQQMIDTDKEEKI